MNRPDAAAWRAFTHKLLNGAGIASLGAGAIFFVAANWQDYGVMGRFVILQVAFAICVGLAFWRPPPAALGQASLVLTTLLTGTLLALFGQTYQTGADVFELFFIWAALALPFALAGGSAAVWASWWVVLNVGMALYCGLQDASLGRWFWAGRTPIERPLILLFAGLVNLGGAVLFVLYGRPRWLVRMLAAFGFIYGTIACTLAMVAKDGMSQQDWLVFVLFAGTCAGIAFMALKRRDDVFPMALIFGAWIAISTALLIKHMQFRDLGNFFVLALWLIATSTATGFVLMRWVRAWKVSS